MHTRHAFYHSSCLKITLMCLEGEGPRGHPRDCIVAICMLCSASALSLICIAPGLNYIDFFLNTFLKIHISILINYIIMFGVKLCHKVIQKN